jgi:hypothetical protein
MNHGVLIMALGGIFFPVILIANGYAMCSGVDCGNGTQSQGGVIISQDTFSPSSQVDILIHAPDFNSNPYAIDKIGDGDSKVVISTRESSINYRLVETGPDTGDFAGYVTLSSTSVCSDVCGPTDGFIAASGDDAITVSLIYSGRIVSSMTYGHAQIIHDTIPEFPYAECVLIMGVASLIYFSKWRSKSVIF